MKVELTLKDLRSLVRGTAPNYCMMTHPVVKKYGHFVGGHLDRWYWDDLSEATEQELWELYQLCNTEEEK